MRFVVDPDGVVVPDVAARLPGRGLWVVPDRAVLEQAASRNLFSRAARSRVQVPADLVERTTSLLTNRCIEFLSMARRARSAVGGFELVRDWLRQGQVGLLVEASDGAADGRRKLAALARDVPVAAALRADEIGTAFGRPHMVHAALGPGRLARQLMNEMDRLAGLRVGTATQAMGG